MPSKIISFTLDGRPVEVLAKPLTTLQAVLREQLGETGTKDGCRQGGCGSCTVLVDGEPMNSCLLPVEDVEGQSVTTIKGIAPPGVLHPVQQAFLDRLATQCGYCTPGMILVAKALLDRNPNPSRAQVAEALSGNHCRCTGYEPIIQAVLAAAQRAAGSEGG